MCVCLSVCVEWCDRTFQAARVGVRADDVVAIANLQRGNRVCLSFQRRPIEKTNSRQVQKRQACTERKRYRGEREQRSRKVAEQKKARQKWKRNGEREVE